MADQAGQVNAFKRAWPSPKPPAVKAGTKKRGTSCTTDSVRLAEADNLIAGRSLGMVVLCAADVDRFRQGKGALTHPPQPTSPALKTHATFPVLGAAVSQVWPAGPRGEPGAWPTFAVRSRCARIALRPPRARSHPFPSPSPRQLTSTRSPHAGTGAWSRADDAIGQGEHPHLSWGTLAAGSGCRRPPPPQMLTNGMHSRVT